ncbi:MAG: hypothetical protein AB1779_00375 [Candidatus Thermoplasmatota archaeon]
MAPYTYTIFILAVVILGIVAFLIFAFFAKLFQLKGTKFKTRVIFGLAFCVYLTLIIFLIVLWLTENVIQNIGRGIIFGVILSIPWLYFYYKIGWPEKRIKGGTLLYDKRDIRRNVLGVIVATPVVCVIMMLVGPTNLIFGYIWVMLALVIAWLISQIFLLFRVIRLESKLGASIIENYQK